MFKGTIVKGTEGTEMNVESKSRGHSRAIENRPTS